MKIPPLDLISRVRRGEVNLDLLVETLRDRGYITEQDQVAGCGFGSSAMEAMHGDDFKALFSFFYPSEAFDIDVHCAATDKDGSPGSFSYALYNANAISRDQVLGLLRKQNKESLAWFAGKV